MIGERKGDAVLVDLAERKSRLASAGKAQNKSTNEVTRVTLELL